jgi:hypothetical protein
VYIYIHTYKKKYEYQEEECKVWRGGGDNMKLKICRDKSQRKMKELLEGGC